MQNIGDIVTSDVVIVIELVAITVEVIIIVKVVDIFSTCPGVEAIVGKVTHIYRYC